MTYFTIGIKVYKAQDSTRNVGIVTFSHVSAPPEAYVLVDWGDGEAVAMIESELFIVNAQVLKVNDVVHGSKGKGIVEDIISNSKLFLRWEGGARNVTVSIDTLTKD